MWNSYQSEDSILDQCVKRLIARTAQRHSRDGGTPLILSEEVSPGSVIGEPSVPLPRYGMHQDKSTEGLSGTVCKVKEVTAYRMWDILQDAGDEHLVSVQNLFWDA